MRIHFRAKGTEIEGCGTRCGSAVFDEALLVGVGLRVEDRGWPRMAVVARSS
jgi:hypothetical protein